jgi:TPR repeat protein
MATAPKWKDMKKITLFVFLITLLIACSKHSDNIEPNKPQAEILTEKNQQNDATAQYNLGMMFENGDGVPRDFTKAVASLEKAASQGHVNAMYQLGNMYSHQGRDYAKAVIWYEKAASQGHADAMYQLGRMHDRGLSDGPYDDAKALAWLEQAAAQGHTEAMYYLATDYYEDSRADDVKTLAWLEQAAAQGHANAMYNLGSMYANGQGVTQDLAKAKVWYEKHCKTARLSNCEDYVKTNTE